MMTHSKVVFFWCATALTTTDRSRHNAMPQLMLSEIERITTLEILCGSRVLP